MSHDEMCWLNYLSSCSELVMADGRLRNGTLELEMSAWDRYVYIDC